MRRLARTLLLGGLSLSAGSWLVGATARAEAPPPEPAQATYLSDCAVCHGTTARGTERGPSLLEVGSASVDFELTTGRMPLAVPSRSEDPGRAIVPDPNRTPASPGATPERSAPAYDPARIAELVAYVGELTGNSGPPIPHVGDGDVAQGGQLYRLNCAACHAWAGSGGALTYREAPPLYESTARQTAEAIRVGPGRMPAFGQAALSDAQVDDVTAYVQEIRAPADRGGLSLAHLGPVGEGAAAILALLLLVLALRVIGERG